MIYCEGPKDCEIAIVGDARRIPGRNVCRPFIGDAGQLLNKLLASAGIFRDSCYLTNVIKQRPASNDISSFIKFGKTVVTKTAIYEEHYANFVAEMQSCTANVVIALGNVALYALTEKLGISKQRGSILEATRDFGYRKVIPTYHPAGAIRQYLWSHMISFDLVRALEESCTGVIPKYNDEFGLDPGYLAVINYLDYFQTCPTIAFDIEVTREEVSHISFAISPTKCLVIPFFSEGKHVWNPDQEMEIWRRIAYLLEDKSVVKLGQNLAFDSSFLFNRYGIQVNMMQDTMVAMAIRFPDFPKGLDFITSIYTKRPYYKDDGKQWFKFGGNEEAFRRYNALDSAVCMEAFPQLLGDVREVGNEYTYNEQVRLLEPIVYMANRGVKINTEKLHQKSIEAGERLIKLKESLPELHGERINPASPKQLIEYFYIHKNLPVYTKNGSLTTDETALKRIARKGYPEASTILEIRKIAKLKSTYLEMKMDHGRLKCSFNPVGTKQGRMSSSKSIFGYGGNMQNQPPEMKEAMIADDGCVLVEIDLGQAENRVVAYAANELQMISAFENGEDIHRKTAGLVFGKDPADISDEKGSSDIGGGAYSERFWGKKTNHGLNYDLGYKAFSLLYEIAESEGKKIVSAYHAAYPSVRRWHDKIKKQLGQNRTLTNCQPFGRRREFRDRWSDELFKAAYSFIPQSTVADIIRSWGICYVYYTEMNLCEVELLNTVHDSLILQYPLSMGCNAISRSIGRIKDNLEQPVQYEDRIFTIPADISIGLNLGKKSKNNQVGMVEVSRLIDMNILIDSIAMTEVV